MWGRAVVWWCASDSTSVDNDSEEDELPPLPVVVVLPVARSVCSRSLAPVSLGAGAAEVEDVLPVAAVEGDAKPAASPL